jgi:hypothetical protein
MLALLLALTVATPPTELIPLDGRPLFRDGAAIRLSLSGDGDYRPGDRVRVEVDVAEDGYLLVFRVDGDGLVRVLFPLDPDLDPFVRGGRRYELRGRGARESFMADDRGGTGLVYAALSREPLDLARFASGMHWDYNKLRLEGEDAEAELTWLVRQATSNGRFEYDLLGYRVYGPGFEEAQPVIIAGGGGWYDPYYDCLACGWRTPGTNIRIGLGWYDPWFDPWYWGGGWGGWNGWNTWGGGWGWDPYWGRPGRPITVFPTRPRPTIPNTIYGVRSRPNLPVPTTTRGRVTSVPNTPPRTGSGSGGATPPSRSRPPQSEPTRARPSVERTPTQGGASTGARPTERTSPPATSRPTTPPAQNEGRSRRPNNDLTVPFTVPEPRVVTPSVNRRGTDRPVTMPERPIYRPPTPAPTTDRRSEPNRNDRGTPSRSRTVERPPAPAPAPRTMDRGSSASPASRSAPPATRSAPPPSPPASPPPSSSGRSRSRPGGNN